MRLLRDIHEEQQAVALSDALGDHGIESQVEPSARGSFVVWVVDEEDLREASALVERWIDQGDSPSFDEAARRGRNDRELKARLIERRQRRISVAQRRAVAMSRLRPPVLTWGLIGLSVCVAVLTSLGSKADETARLLFSDPHALKSVEVVLFGRHLSLLALPLHEPYRLLTHVLVHFDPLELLFQLLMLRELGRVIEGVHGARTFAFVVVLCALVAGTAQYEIGQSAQFSGMSGVVFGLLGVVWVRGRFDRRTRYALTRGTVQFMLVWLVLGFVNAFQIAKWCPLFGLLTGAICGLVMALKPARSS